MQHQIISGADQVGCQLGEFAAPITRAAEIGHGFDPGEDLLDPFALFLADDNSVGGPGLESTVAPISLEEPTKSPFPRVWSLRRQARANSGRKDDQGGSVKMYRPCVAHNARAASAWPRWRESRCRIARRSELILKKWCGVSNAAIGRGGHGLQDQGERKRTHR